MKPTTEQIKEVIALLDKQEVPLTNRFMKYIDEDGNEITAYIDPEGNITGKRCI